MKYLFNSIFLASLLIVAFLLFNCEESTIKYRTLPAEKADEGSLFHEENNLNNPSNMQGSILKYEKKGRESGVAITSINKEDTNVIEIAGSVVTYGNYKKPGIALGLIRKSGNGGTEVYLKLYEITPDNNLHNNNKKDSSSKSRFPDRFSAFNSQQTQGNVLKNKLDKATKGYWEDSFSPKYFGSAPSPTLYQVTPSYSKPVLPESKVRQEIS